MTNCEYGEDEYGAGPYNGDCGAPGGPGGGRLPARRGKKREREEIEDEELALILQFVDD